MIYPPRYVLAAACYGMVRFQIKARHAKIREDRIERPMLVTEIFFKKQANLTVYPSHFFMPEHHSKYVSKVTGHHFARHLWGSDIGYDNMDQQLKEEE